MILKELQDFVFDYHCASLAEMELHFQIDGDALRQMLNKLIRKGRVRKLPTSEKCHGCTFCNPNTTEFYEWVDQHHLGSPHLPKNSATKAQIHSIHTPEDNISVTEPTEVKYAVILHNCEATKQKNKQSPNKEIQLQVEDLHCHDSRIPLRLSSICEAVSFRTRGRSSNVRSNR